MFDSLSEESYLMCIIKPFCSQTQFKKDVLLLHNKALKFVHNTFPDTMCNCASFHNQTQFQKIIFCCTMKLQIFIHNTFPLQTSSPLAHSCCNLFLSFEQNFQITKLFFGSGTFFGRTNFPQLDTIPNTFIFSLESRTSKLLRTQTKFLIHSLAENYGNICKTTNMSSIRSYLP